MDDIDLIEANEAFAAQALAVGGELNFPEEKLNVNGGSLAAAHPFAATGGRIVANLAKTLHENGGGRGLISVCAAGGIGVVAILEA